MVFEHGDIEISMTPKKITYTLIMWPKGSFVYLITDPDQLRRMITDWQYQSNGALSYQLSCGTETTWHFEIEFTDEIDTLTKFQN